MRKLRVLSALLAIVLLFSGCSMRISSSIEDLISPVSPFGDNSEVKNALDTFTKKGFTPKTPSQGKYLTAYTFVDLDGDRTKEAIAFYEPNDNLGTAHMAVMKQTEEQWSVVEHAKGFGSDVSSLDFADVNGDGKKELIVCWDSIARSTSHLLALYEFKDGKLNCFFNDVEVNNYAAVDMTGGSAKELLLFEITSGNYNSAKAELYSFINNQARILGETKLDSHISTYVNIQTEKIDGGVRVYADGVGTNGNSMLTELLYWSDRWDSIVSPFYDYSTGLTGGTTRNMLLPSRDVNSDGRIEIPHNKTLKKLPRQVLCNEWRVYKNTILQHTDYTLSPREDGYMVTVPDKYIDEIRVKYDTATRTMTVLEKDGKQEVFSIRPALKATYKEEDIPDYTVIFEDRGYCYLARTGNSKDIKISLSQLKSYIQSIG